MNARSEKTKESKTLLAKDPQSLHSTKNNPTYQFNDKRVKSTTHSVVQQMADESSQSKHAAQLQSMADQYTDAKTGTVQRQENRTGLPDQLKSGIENLSGYAMDDVKVHRNSDKPAQLQAHAYAQGSNIYLGPGQEKHLAHEAWHVVQQKQGRVTPTRQFKEKVPINDDSGLEREADIMGAKAMEFSGNPETTQLKTTTLNQQPIQRKPGDQYRKKKNDLIYGTYKDRLNYEPKLGAMNRAFSSMDGDSIVAKPELDEPLIADFMNDLFLGTKKGSSYGNAVDETPDIAKDNTAYRDFIFYIHRYLAPKFPHGSEEEGNRVRIAAACKFGIWLTAKQGRNVHFVLDELNTNKIQHNIASGKSSSFTSRELRFVRNSWHDKDISQHVKFYVKQKEVAPPWETYQNEWAAFKPGKEHGLDLSQKAEDEVQALQKLTINNNELEKIQVEVSQLISERSEKLELITTMTEEIKELQETNTPTFFQNMKTFFGGTNTTATKMHKNLQKAKHMASEVKSLIAEARELGEKIISLNQESMKRAKIMKIHLNNVSSINIQKEEFFRNPPPPLDKVL
ncbi:hypothetical protein TPENAI_10296 [Tenacibaculum litopenaei]|uniref:eCIS core domain-containing protein n=1 Tax=Tenacibaculum litopenaei TaxID=396016 RepID=UPI003892F1AF